MWIKQNWKTVIRAGLLLGVGAVSGWAQTAPPQEQSEAERTLYQKYYEAVQKQPGAETTCALAQEFAQKFPQSQYAKYAQQTMSKCRLDRFQKALNEFYAAPDATRLQTLVTASETILQEQPDQIYINAHLAMALSRAAINGYYKDQERAKTQAERALKLVESETPPAGWKAEDYTPLRQAAQAQLNQYLAWQILQQEKPDTDRAIALLQQAMQIKSKDAFGWKDPNNYSLRASAYAKQYETLSAQYQALPDAEKTADAGKALLIQINALADRMIDDYARVVALAKQPAQQPLSDAAREQLTQLWKYRHDDKTEGLEDYIKAFENDPSATPLKP
jgi:predicted negative regulator of RcsB-dependent stress response